MGTTIKYDALEKASNILNNTLDSDALYKLQDALSNTYDFLSQLDKNHNCFSTTLESLQSTQEDCVTPTKNYLKLTYLLPLIIQEFQEAEDKTVEDLKSFINEFFSNSGMGLLPFSYKEIEELNGVGVDDFRIQGYTIAGDYYLISVYDKHGVSNSRVYIYDKAGRCLGYMKLKSKKDSKAHVGGITYDEERDILFITGKGGVVNTYKLKDVTDALNQVSKQTGKLPSISENADLKIIQDGSVNISKYFDKTTSAATTYYSPDEKVLYVADCAGTGTLIKYSVSVTNKGISFGEGKVVSENFASCCQGVATYQDAKGKNYIYASQSYGADHDSVIKKYEVTSTGIKEVGATTISTPGLEGIQIDNQGNLSGVFENFKNSSNKNQTLHLNVNTTDFSKTLLEQDEKLEEFYIKCGTENQESMNK